ncbi:Aldehyde dehydrogenase family protein, partial [Quadrisphaera granulorum]
MSETQQTVQHWIDGVATSGASTRTADVFDPATGQVARLVVLAEPADVDAAVASAKAAFPAWRDTSLAKRTQVLFAFRELLNARA